MWPLPSVWPRGSPGSGTVGGDGVVEGGRGGGQAALPGSCGGWGWGSGWGGGRGGVGVGTLAWEDSGDGLRCPSLTTQCPRVGQTCICTAWAPGAGGPQPSGHAGLPRVLRDLPRSFRLLLNICPTVGEPHEKETSLVPPPPTATRDVCAGGYCVSVVSNIVAHDRVGVSCLRSTCAEHRDFHSAPCDAPPLREWRPSLGSLADVFSFPARPSWAHCQIQALPRYLSALDLWCEVSR